MGPRDRLKVVENGTFLAFLGIKHWLFNQPVYDYRNLVLCLKHLLHTGCKANMEIK
jgi:hypothetical protein